MKTQSDGHPLPVDLRVDHAIPASRRIPALANDCYSVKLVKDVHEFQETLRLRYRVFNLELREGLVGSVRTGQDFDEFDAVLEHIIVKGVADNSVVGTCRVQTGSMAARNLGYYSQQEFDLTPFEPIRHQVVELGRACIDQDHRNTAVLSLLWKAIAQYALARSCRYLIGCISLSSQDPVAGTRVFAQLQRSLAPSEFLTVPRPAHAFELRDGETSDEAKVPKLLRAYLAAGAVICGPPAIDREFRTIDFLTLLDLGRLPAGARGRFIGE